MQCPLQEEKHKQRQVTVSMNTMRITCCFLVDLYAARKVKESDMKSVLIWTEVLAYGISAGNQHSAGELIPQKEA